MLLLHMVIVCCVHEQSSMSMVGQASPPCPSVSLFACLSSSLVRCWTLWWHRGQRCFSVCLSGSLEGAAFRWTGSPGCWWRCADGGWCCPDALQFVEGSPLCHCHQRVQLHADHRDGPPDQLFKPGEVCLCCAPARAHHSIGENAGDHGLIQHP